MNGTAAGSALDPAGRRRRARSFALVFALFALPAIAFSVFGVGQGQADAQSTPTPVQQREAAAGRLPFEQHCSTCHGPLGQGTGQGPNILGRGPADYDFQMSTGRMPLAQAGEQAIRKQPALTPREIQDITAYLVSLAPGGIDIPRVNVGDGDLSQGQQAYALNCAACHSTNGNGGAVGPQIAPPLHAATIRQIAEAIRIGPGAMPVFDANVIPAAQLNSLVRYVLYLRDPAHPGGAPLGYNGPIVEGFIALLVALGAVIVVTRYIGERS